jgi:peptide/nickel transport system substrate-binding protein
MGRRVRVVAAVAAVALVAAACNKSSGGGSTNPGSVKSGGVFRLGTSSTIDSLNPFLAFQANAILVFVYTYPYLTSYDQRNNIVPWFAKSWEASPDGLTWTFHLVSNAKWSDGQPMNANDVAWMYNTVVKYQNGPASIFAGYVTGLKTATATDPSTVTFTYSSPVSDAVEQLSAIPILPEHVWGSLATGSAKELKSYQNTPQDGKPVVSGGPFELVKYQKDQVALLQRNPNWWGQKPHMDGFGIQIFSNDDAMITALKTNQLDGVESVPFTDVTKVSQAGFKVTKTPGVFFYDFIINSNPKKTVNRELLDPTVKQAFEYAIDRKSIIQTALLGYGTTGDSIIPPAIAKWHDPNLHALPFDLAKANQLLDGLGFAKGSDGIRVADGHPMSYSVIVPNSRTGDLSPTFQIMQNDFRQIGVQLKLKVMDPSAAFDAIGAPNYTYKTFDLAMWDWIPGPDPSSILSVLLCNQYGSNSDTGYCNPTYDDLYKQQTEAIDQKKRLQLVYQMQEMVFNDRPYIILNYPDVIDGYSPRWTNFFQEFGYGIFDTEGAQSFIQAHLA